MPSKTIHECWHKKSPLILSKCKIRISKYLKLCSVTRNNRMSPSPQKKNDKEKKIREHSLITRWQLSSHTDHKLRPLQQNRLQTPQVCIHQKRLQKVMKTSKCFQNCNHMLFYLYKYTSWYNQDKSWHFFNTTDIGTCLLPIRNKISNGWRHLSLW